MIVLCASFHLVDLLFCRCAGCNRGLAEAVQRHQYQWSQCNAKYRHEPELYVAESLFSQY